MFAEQTVLISGSSRGIGAATARLAKQYGATVILHGRTDSRRLSELSRELDTPYTVCDISDAAAVQSCTGRLIRDYGRIHALINCAGVVEPRPFAEASEEQWMPEFRTNLMGTVYLCQALAPTMLQSGYGRIVNVASIRAQAHTASARGMAYSASKAAVVSFSVSLAKELAPKVNVNAVLPGFVKTDMSETWNDVVWQQAQSALVARVAEPQEIAELLLFLASEKASFITGQSFIADGGYSVSGK